MGRYADYKVWVWDVASGKLLNILDMDGELTLKWLVFNPVEDQLVVSASDEDDTTIRVWDFALGGWTGAAWVFASKPVYYSPLRISPRGDMIFIDSPGSSALIDSRSGEQLPLPSLAWEVQDVTFSPDGLYAAVQYEDETIIYIVGK